MRTRVEWIETSKDAYRAIYGHHRKNLVPYSVYTNPYGDDGLSYTPEIYTSWGFKNGNYEVIACRKTKKYREQSEWDSKYYLAETVICEECE